MPPGKSKSVLLEECLHLFVLRNLIDRSDKSIPLFLGETVFVTSNLLTVVRLWRNHCKYGVIKDQEVDISLRGSTLASKVCKSNYQNRYLDAQIYPRCPKAQKAVLDYLQFRHSTNVASTNAINSDLFGECGIALVNCL